MEIDEILEESNLEARTYHLPQNPMMTQDDVISFDDKFEAQDAFGLNYNEIEDEDEVMFLSQTYGGEETIEKNKFGTNDQTNNKPINLKRDIGNDRLNKATLQNIESLKSPFISDLLKDEHITFNQIPDRVKEAKINKVPEIKIGKDELIHQENKDSIVAKAVLNTPSLIKETTIPMTKSSVQPKDQAKEKVSPQVQKQALPQIQEQTTFHSQEQIKPHIGENTIPKVEKKLQNPQNLSGILFSNYHNETDSIQFENKGCDKLDITLSGFKIPAPLKYKSKLNPKENEQQKKLETEVEDVHKTNMLKLQNIVQKNLQHTPITTAPQNILVQKAVQNSTTQQKDTKMENISEKPKTGILPQKAPVQNIEIPKTISQKSEEKPINLNSIDSAKREIKNIVQPPKGACLNILKVNNESTVEEAKPSQPIQPTKANTVKVAPSKPVTKTPETSLPKPQMQNPFTKSGDIRYPLSESPYIARGNKSTSLDPKKQVAPQVTLGSSQNNFPSYRNVLNQSLSNQKLTFNASENKDKVKSEIIESNTAPVNNEKKNSISEDVEKLHVPETLPLKPFSQQRFNQPTQLFNVKVKVEGESKSNQTTVDKNCSNSNQNEKLTIEEKAFKKVKVEVPPKKEPQVKEEAPKRVKEVFSVENTEPSTSDS